jgi:hypothetical protein
MRYPDRKDLPLSVSVAGAHPTDRTLKLEQTERIAIPLSADHPTDVSLSSPRSFTLSSADPRVRSYRIVNIDFQ